MTLLPAAGRQRAGPGDGPHPCGAEGRQLVLGEEPLVGGPPGAGRTAQGTHTLTHSHSQTRTLTRPHVLLLSLSHTLTLTLMFSLSLSHTLMLTLSHSLSL